MITIVPTSRAMPTRCTDWMAGNIHEFFNPSNPRNPWLLCSEQRPIIAIVLADELVDSLQIRPQREVSSQRVRFLENVRIFDRHFVLHRLEICPLETLDHVQAFRMLVALEFGLVVESDGVDDQCFPFPVAYRIAHPARIGIHGMRAAVRGYDA